MYARLVLLVDREGGVSTCNKWLPGKAETTLAERAMRLACYLLESS